MNIFVITGNVAKDVDVHVTNNGIKQARITLAVNRRYRNAQGVREADFFNCICWREKADFAEKYVTKGKKLCITGEVQNRSYEAQDGSKRYVTEVMVEQIEFCGAKNDGEKGKEEDEEKEDEEKPMQMTPADDADDLPFESRVSLP